jgi:PiT family inorganic phosphate transporter
MLLAFVFGWNNGPVVVGGLVGSGALSYRRGALWTVIGLALGSALGWREMQYSLVDSLSLLRSPDAVTFVFLLSFVLILVLTLGKLPVSLSVSAVGAFIGASLALGFGVHRLVAIEILSSWLAAPLIGGLLAFALEKLLRAVYERMNVLRIDIINRTLTQVSMLYVTFTLGANNVGMIFGTYAAVSSPDPLVLIALVAFCVVGVTAVGKTLAPTIGESFVGLSPSGVLASFISSSFVMLASTLAGIPMSVTMALVGSMVGVGMSTKLWIINRPLIAYTVGSWLAVALLSGVVAFLTLHLALG